MDFGWEMDSFGESVKILFHDQQDKISAENGRLNLYRDPFLIDAYYEEHAQCYEYEGELHDSYNLQRHYSPVFGQHYHDDQTLHNDEEPNLSEWPVAHSYSLNPPESRESSSGDDTLAAALDSSSSVTSSTGAAANRVPATSSSSSGLIRSAAGAKCSTPAKAAAAATSPPTSSSLADFVPMAAVCPICGHKFYDDLALAAHIVVHDGVTIAHCALCGRRMKPDSLVAHYDVYHPGAAPTVRENTTVAKTFKCSDCPMWFATSYNYKYNSFYVTNHAQRKHGKKRHECPVCGETFDDTEERRKHRFEVHGSESSRACEKTYKCSECPLRFATIYTCRNHAKKKHGKKLHDCPDCDEGFDSTSERREHRLVAHGKDPIFDESLARWNSMMSREALGRPTADEELLDPYADQLLDPGPIELEERITQSPSSPDIILLDQESTSQEAQMEHLQEVGEESVESPMISYEESSSDSAERDTPPPSPKEAEDKFRCKLCSKVFDNRKRYNGHQKFHYKFQCPICGSRLKWRKALIAHCLTFHPEKCSSIDLQGTGKDIVIARKEEFKCGACDKSFRHRYQLERHERNHTGEKPFPCPQCPLAFNYPHILKRHLISCTKKRQKLLDESDLLTLAH
ncbi:hypothetical protein PRIPAC_73738 [Pristionchus pacificus]|uniref:Zinc finger protein n=1 Tax=Pristionchus pacificus TaxID=54126 RepID=A0A2A6C8W3_PRIPA|nr:hypothetical protein PRIPAC_73738 [Pristionchus pacificus]|eukprot:PDM74546.1 zinc finger protein [Pristionchus pacificus]